MPYPPRSAIAATMLAAALTLSACGGGGGNGETPQPPGRPVDVQVRVSGLTPFAPGCQETGIGGTLYASAEVEPSVAVNPLDAANLVGVWQQDRWSSGGARGLLTGASFDGGQTWSTRMAAFSRCAGGTPENGGDYERASDPWVSFAPDGTAYQIAVAFTGDNFVTDSVNAILVSRSADGGRSWSNPATLIRDGSAFFNDKESITADPTDARYVYAVWDRLALSGNGPTWFGRTADGGRTWEAARPIFDPGPRNQTLNNQIVVLPDGTLVNFCTRIVTAANGSARASLVVMRSPDKGVTWSAPIEIVAVQALGARDPETGALIRDGANLGSIAAGRDGTLAVVWQDGRFSGGTIDGIAFSRSTDGGLTWSAPVRINAAPDVQAFVPTVHVRSDGTIGVTHYDLRNNTNDRATLPTDYWLLYSNDGATWRETHVSGPFDFAVAPNARGLFVGDYQALTSIGNVFVPFYGQTNTGNTSNRTDIFVSLMSSATTTMAKAAAMSSSSGRESEATIVRAESAPPLAMTPELSQRLTESLVRTMERRVPGWTPGGIVRVPGTRER